MGAQCSPKLHKILSYINYLPPPIPKYGFTTRYPKDSKPVKKEEELQDYNRMGRWKPLYVQHKLREQRNLIIRQLKAEMFLHEHLKTQNVTVEEIPSDDEDIDSRTKNFLRLREVYRQFEKDAKATDGMRRETVIRKMNKLAMAGIHKEEPIPEVLGINEKAKAGEQNISHKEALYNVILEEMHENYLRLQREEDDMKPITQEEFSQHVESAKGVPIDPRVVGAVFEEAAKLGFTITRHDAKLVSKDYNENLDLGYMDPAKWNIKSEKLIIPNPNPITPFPDLNAYDPEEYFDPKAGPSTPVKSVRPYGKPIDVWQPEHNKKRGMDWYRRKKTLGMRKARNDYK